MDATSEVGGRITRSLRRRLNSAESESPSRGGTPILTVKLTPITESGLLSPSRPGRVTRRNSTSLTTPLRTSTGNTTLRDTPKKRAGRNAKIAIEEENTSVDSHNVSAVTQKQKSPIKLSGASTHEQGKLGSKSKQKIEETTSSSTTFSDIEVDVMGTSDEDVMETQIKVEQEEQEEQSMFKIDKNEDCTNINSRNISFNDTENLYMNTAKTNNMEKLINNNPTAEKPKALRLILKNLNKSNTSINVDAEKNLKQSPKQVLGLLPKNEPNSPKLANSQIHTSGIELSSIGMDKTSNDENKKNSENSTLEKANESLNILQEDSIIPLGENGINEDNISKNLSEEKRIQSLDKSSEQSSCNVTVEDVDSEKNEVTNMQQLSTIENNLTEFEQECSLKNASISLDTKGENNTSGIKSQEYIDFIQSPLKDKNGGIKSTLNRRSTAKDGSNESGEADEKEESSDQSLLVNSILNTNIDKNMSNKSILNSSPTHNSNSENLLEQSARNDATGRNADFTQGYDESIQQPMLALNNFLECEHEESMTNTSVLLDKKDEANTSINKFEESVDSIQSSSKKEHIREKRSTRLHNSREQSSRNVSVGDVDSTQSEGGNNQGLISIESSQMECEQEQFIKNASILLEEKGKDCEPLNNSQKSIAIDPIQNASKTKSGSIDSILNEENTVENVCGNGEEGDDKKESSYENGLNKSISRKQAVQNQSLENLRDPSSYEVMGDDDENKHPLILVEDDPMECEGEFMKNASVLSEQYDENSAPLNKLRVSVDSIEGSAEKSHITVKNSTFNEENTDKDEDEYQEEEEREKLSHQYSIIQWTEKGVSKQTSYNKKKLDVIDINNDDHVKEPENKVSQHISNENINPKNSKLNITHSFISVIKNDSNEVGSTVRDNKKGKTNFFEVEAGEVENYTSGDSMESEEKEEMLLNEIPVDYESLGSNTTVEQEVIDNEEEEEEFDSFIDDNDSTTDNVEKYKRIKPLYSSDDSEPINKSIEVNTNDSDNQIVEEKFKHSDETTNDRVGEEELQEANSSTNYDGTNDDAEATSQSKVENVQLKSNNLQGEVITSSSYKDSNIEYVKTECTKKDVSKKLSASFPGRAKAVKRKRRSSPLFTKNEEGKSIPIDLNQIDNHDKKHDILKINPNTDDSPESNQYQLQIIDLNETKKDNENDTNKTPEPSTKATTVDTAAKEENMDKKFVEENFVVKIKNILNRCNDMLKDSELRKTKAQNQYKKDKKKTKKLKRKKNTSAAVNENGVNPQIIPNQERKPSANNKRPRMESPSDNTDKYKSNERTVTRLTNNISKVLVKQNIKGEEKHKTLKKVSACDIEEGDGRKKKILKTFNAAGIVFETSPTPVKKARIKTIATSSGPVLVEPITPPKSVISRKNKKGQVPLSDVSDSKSTLSKKRQILKQTNADSIVLKSSPMPVKKDKSKTIRTLLGPMLVEPITLKNEPNKKENTRLMELSNSESEELKGKVSKIFNVAGPVLESTPTPIKKKKVLTKSLYRNIKMLPQSSKNIKTNRCQVKQNVTNDTKLYTLPKPQWNGAGFYIEEPLEVHVIQNTATTKFLVRSLQKQRKIKKSNVNVCKQQINVSSNFKATAQKRPDIKQTSAREIIQRKMAHHL